MTIFAKGAHYAIPGMVAVKIKKLTVFQKQSFFPFIELSAAGYNVVGIDWTIDPEIARNLTGGNVTLQGNLDPCALYAPKEKLKEMTVAMVKRFAKKNYIANLGHGIYPDMDPDNVQVFIDAVHSV